MFRSPFKSKANGSPLKSEDEKEPIVSKELEEIMSKLHAKIDRVLKQANQKEIPKQNRRRNSVAQRLSFDKENIETQVESERNLGQSERIKPTDFRRKRLQRESKG
jgi:hypothetical protein